MNSNGIFAVDVYCSVRSSGNSEFLNNIVFFRHWGTHLLSPVLLLSVQSEEDNLMSVAVPLYQADIISVSCV